MEKHQKNELVVLRLRHLGTIPFMVILLATGCASSVPELEFMSLDSTCFSVYYTRGHQDPSQDVLEALEVNHDRITEDLKPTKEDKYAIWIYPNLNTFHRDLLFQDIFNLTPVATIGLALRILLLSLYWVQNGSARGCLGFIRQKQSRDHKLKWYPVLL